MTNEGKRMRSGRRRKREGVRAFLNAAISTQGIFANCEARVLERWGCWKVEMQGDVAREKGGRG